MVNNNIAKGLEDIVNRVFDQRRAAPTVGISKQVFSAARSVAEAAGVSIPLPTPHVVQLAPVTGYARPNAQLLVWPSPGRGYGGLLNHWRYYKTRLRAIYAQGKRPAWQNTRNGKSLHNHRHLMEEIARRSGPDDKHEVAILGVMRNMLEGKGVSLSVFCKCL